MSKKWKDRTPRQKADCIWGWSLILMFSIFLVVFAIIAIKQEANAQQSTPWANTKTVKYFRVSVSSFREDYTWDIEASSVVEARAKVFKTLKKLYGKAWTTKSGKVVLYEK